MTISSSEASGSIVALLPVSGGGAIGWRDGGVLSIQSTSSARGRPVQ